jgi:transposase-like protein
MIKQTRHPKEFREALVAEISLGQWTIAQVSKSEIIAGQNRLRAAKDLCNTGQSHSSLGNGPPATFRREFETRSREKGLQF